MITADCMDRMLPTVADSWQQLRGCDVYRLLDSIAYDHPQSVADAACLIREKRPDLEPQVIEAAADIAAEMEL